MVHHGGEVVRSMTCIARLHVHQMTQLMHLLHTPVTSGFLHITVRLWEYTFVLSNCQTFKYLVTAVNKYTTFTFQKHILRTSKHCRIMDELQHRCAFEFL